VVEAFSYSAGVIDIDLLVPRHAKVLKFTSGRFGKGVFAACGEVRARYDLAISRVCIR
jgi:hypothetical protein